MRRASILLVLLMILAVVIGAAGCGGSSAAGTAAKADTPQSVLSSALNASQSLTSATGNARRVGDPRHGHQPIPR